MKINLQVATAIFLAVAFSISTVRAAFENEKPLVVTITSEWCATCQKLKPVIDELKDEYDGQVTFVTLSPSSKASLEEARETAEEYGISEFLEHSKGVFPTVGFLCPQGKKVEKVFVGETNKEVYEEALDELLSNTARVCSL